jgi:hypothetical protein
MLRALLVLLVLANGATWLFGLGPWAGTLAAWGLAPAELREPQRLTQQIRPDSLRVLPGVVATSSPPVVAEEMIAGTQDVLEPRGPEACWQAAGFLPAQAEELKAAIDGVPALTGRWRWDESVLPERWIVYLGRFSNADALQRRKAELRQAKVEYRDVYVPALSPGLALGTYSTEDAAKTALTDVQRDGVKGAKVVQERQEYKTFTLKLPTITDDELALVQGLGTALAGKSLQKCP